MGRKKTLLEQVIDDMARRRCSFPIRIIKTDAQIRRSEKYQEKKLKKIIDDMAMEFVCEYCKVEGKIRGDRVPYCPIFLRKDCPNQLLLEKEEEKKHEEAKKMGIAYRKRMAYMKKYKK